MPTYKIGDIIWGINPDTSLIAKALQQVTAFGAGVEQTAARAQSLGTTMDTVMLQQERTWANALARITAFQQKLQQAGAPPAMITQSAQAFNQLAAVMGKNNATALDMNRANMLFAGTMSGLQNSFAKWRAEAGNSTSMMEQFQRATQLVTGPLSGLAYRVTVLKEIFNESTMRMALFAGGIVGVGYAFAKISESALHAEEGLTKVRLQLIAATNSQTEMQGDMKLTMDIANRYGASFESVAEHFARMNLAARNTTLEGQKVRELFTGIVAASQSMGDSQEQLSGKLNNMTELIGRQRLQWRDLRSILINEFPGALEASARAMGTTQAAFEQMLKRGDVMATQFLPKFIQSWLQLHNIDPSKDINNMNSAHQRLKNTFLELLDSFDNLMGIQSRYISSTNELTAIISYLKDHMQETAATITALGAAFLTYLVGPAVISGIHATITGVADLIEAIKNLTSVSAAAAAIGGLMTPVGWITLAASIAAAAAAYVGFNHLFKENKDQVLGSIPALRDYIAQYDRLKNTALDTAQAELAVAQAALVAAQVKLATATKQQVSIETSVTSDGKLKDSAASSATGWWSYFLKVFSLQGEAASIEMGQDVATVIMQADAQARAAVGAAAQDVVAAQADVVKMQKIIDSIRTHLNGLRDAKQADTAAQIAMQNAMRDFKSTLDDQVASWHALALGPQAFADQQKNTQIDKTVREWIDKFTRLGMSLQEATAKATQLGDAMRKLADMQAADKAFMSLGQTLQYAVGELGTNAIDAFSKALVTGGLNALKFKDLVDSALEAIIKKIMELAVLAPIMNGLFGPGTMQGFSFQSLGSGTGGLVGSLLSALGLQPNQAAAGAAMGQGGIGHAHGGLGAMTYGFVNPAVFAGAPRLHTGLMPDEFPAILQRGETVTPKGGTPQGGANVMIKIQHPPGTQAEARRSNAGGQDLYDIIITHVKQGMANGELDRHMQGRYGALPFGVRR